MKCEKCAFASSVCPKIAAHVTRYHMKYHHPVCHLWWEPLFWLTVLHDFIRYWAFFDYEKGTVYSWHTFKMLPVDLRLSYEMVRRKFGLD